MQTKLVVSMVVAGALAGCGSQSGFDFDTFEDVLEAVNENDALVAGLSQTAVNTVPSSGTAEFVGTVTIYTEDDTGIDPSVIGGMSVTVDFADAANITGSAGDFFDIAQTPVNGELTLTEASNLNSSGFDMVLEGQLENVGASGEDANFDYRVEITQEFRGDGVRALEGRLGAASATQVGTSNTNTLVATSGLVRD